MNRVYKWYLRMHNSNYAFIRRFIEVMLHIIFSCDIPPEVKIYGAQNETYIED